LEDSLLSAHVFGDHFIWK